MIKTKRQYGCYMDCLYLGDESNPQWAEIAKLIDDLFYLAKNAQILLHGKGISHVGEALARLPDWMKEDTTIHKEHIRSVLSAIGAGPDIEVI